MEKIKELNNFEIDAKAKELSDSHSAYALARLYINKSEELEKLRRQVQTK
jgi:hypothetical protein